MPITRAITTRKFAGHHTCLLLHADITARTIATGILQSQLEKEATFPRQMVYAYVLFNTLFIALIYIPVSIRLAQHGRKAIDSKLANINLEENPELFLNKKKTLRGTL